MNKLLKGSIAGAAGVALLLGGAGTFALWNAEAPIQGGTITAGTLEVLAGEGVWADQFGAVEIGEYLIVPGDTLTYKTSVSVEAAGDNLKAVLSVEDRTFTAATGAAGTALATFMKENTTLTVTNPTAKVPLVIQPRIGNDGPSYTLTPANGLNKYEVEVTLTFPSGVSGAENAAMNGAVSLNEFGVTLEQVLLPVPAPSTTPVIAPPVL